MWQTLSTLVQLPDSDQRRPTFAMQIILPNVIFCGILNSDWTLNRMQSNTLFRWTMVSILLVLYARNLGLYTTMDSNLPNLSETDYPIKLALRNIADFSVSNFAVLGMFQVLVILGGVGNVVKDPRNLKRWKTQTVAVKKEEKPIYESNVPRSGTLSRWRWSVELMTALRGVGWNWGEESHSFSWPLSYKHRVSISRKRFVWQTSIQLLKTYLIADLVTMVNRTRPCFRDDSIQREGCMAWFPIPSPSTFPSVILDIILACLSGYIAIQVNYLALSLFLVILGLSSPDLYPPFFGGWKHLHSLESFWSKFWHQAFRHCFISLSNPIVNLTAGLGFSKQVQKITRITVSFALSALLHALPNFAFLRRWPTGSLCFFMSQPLGIVLQRTILGHQKQDNQGWVIVSYLWTILWLMVTSPWLMQEYIEGGFWNLDLAPFSLIGWILDTAQTVMTFCFVS